MSYHKLELITDAELDTLDKLALPATEGPWIDRGPWDEEESGGQFHWISPADDSSPEAQICSGLQPEDAAFIVALDPTLIRKLVQEVRSLRAALQGKVVDTYDPPGGTARYLTVRVDR